MFCFLEIKLTLLYDKNINESCTMGGASQVALVVKNRPANAGDMRGRFDPWV